MCNAFSTSLVILSQPFDDYNLQALQKQVAQLAVENDMLKGIVRQRLGGSKSASQVQNAPLNSAQVRTVEIFFSLMCSLLSSYYLCGQY